MSWVVAVLVLVTGAVAFAWWPSAGDGLVVVDAYEGLPPGVNVGLGETEPGWVLNEPDRTVAVYLAGSSTCMPRPVDLRVEDDVLVVEVESGVKAPVGPCTLDLRYATTVIRLPAEVDDLAALDVQFDRLPAGAGLSTDR